MSEWEGTLGMEGHVGKVCLGFLFAFLLVGFDYWL